MLLLLILANAKEVSLSREGGGVAPTTPKS